MKKVDKVIVKQKGIESRLDDIESRLELLEHQFKNRARYVLEDSKGSQVGQLSQLDELSKGLQELQSILGQLGAK